MKIRILWVGRTREGWAVEGISKYLKLLRPFVEVELVEIKEEKGKAPVSHIVEAEGRRIMEKATSYILLDERGTKLSSESLGHLLEDQSRMEFVLGGPWGVSEEVKNKAVRTVSLSDMTLTHEMARLLFLEQVYRGFTIITGRKYHH